MLFPTMIFGIFFLIVYAAAWTLDRESRRRKQFLLAASWVFYAWWDWRFVGLLAVSATLNWWIGRAIGRLLARGGATRRKRLWLVALGVTINLIVLGFFKYYGFFTDQLQTILHAVGWARDLPLLQVILPIGVSFFTFQGISYIVDVHRGKVAAAPALLDVMLLMSFFPHLVAGPIVRASDLLPQFEKPARLTRDMATHGLLLIVWGLFKKTVIASQLATSLVDPVFFDPASHTAPDLLLAAYGYAVQIYCDFSAYSDMAIGLAALLGYQFPRNFDQPYRASSLQDFWRRWHISLSSWLRDYLYIPLGGSRGGVVRTCINVMITMLLGGLWHGAAWTFVAWGALHGTGLCVERLWRLKLGRRPPPTWAGVLITFHVVCLAWILFRSETFGGALTYLQGFTRMSGGLEVATPLAVVLIGLGLLLHALPPRAVEETSAWIRRLPSPVAGLAVGLAFLLVEALRDPGVAPFIYYQF